MAYIYKLTLLVDIEHFKAGMIYIGQSKGTKGNSYFSGGVTVRYLIKKYGRDIFSREKIVEGSLSGGMLNTLEIMFIEAYDSVTNGLNIRLGGSLPNPRQAMPVFQYDTRGRKLNNYRCAADAAFAVGLTTGGVRAAIRTKGFTRTKCGTFFWSHSDVEVIPVKFPIRNREVHVRDSNETYLDCFPSAFEAAKACGLKEFVVGRVIDTGKIKNGFKFYSKKDKEPIAYQSRFVYDVHMFSLKGEYVRTFSSKGDAERATGISRKFISEAINPNGNQKTAGGFQWRLNRNSLLPDLSNNPHTGHKKPVTMLDLNNTVLRSFGSCREAASFIKMDEDSFTNRLQKNRNVFEGYRWELI